jgi:hypothetical protein
MPDTHHDDSTRRFFVDIATGEEIAHDDMDALIASYERASDLYVLAKDARYQLQALIGAHAKGDTRTQRLRTKDGVEVLVERHAVSYRQAALKRLWKEYPTFAKRYLRIERIAPALREIKKLETTTSTDPKLAHFQLALNGAKEANHKPPKVTIVARKDIQGVFQPINLSVDLDDDNPIEETQERDHA